MTSHILRINQFVDQLLQVEIRYSRDGEQYTLFLHRDWFTFFLGYLLTLVPKITMILHEN